MSGYYDRNGQPMTMMEWAAAFEDTAARIIGRTTVAEGVEVSTVWMGIDHQFGDGPPLIFESMVFGGPLSDETRRYSTEDEARRGHAKLVAEASP